MPNIAVLIVCTAPPGAPSPRLFAKVDNREVFMRTIELYANRDAVTQRILCVTPDDLSTVQQKYSAHLGFQGVSVTAGGPDWFGLVARGLEKLKAEVDVVITHDACRPAVPYTLLDALEQAVGATGAAVPVAGAGYATLATLTAERNVDEWRATEGLVEVQSPQIFSRKILVEAYAARANVKGLLLDDASLVRACGGRITTAPGSRLNQRLDGDDMLRMAGDLLKHLPRPKAKALASPFDEAQW